MGGFLKEWGDLGSEVEIRKIGVVGNQRFGIVTSFLHGTKTFHKLEPRFPRHPCGAYTGLSLPGPLYFFFFFFFFQGSPTQGWVAWQFREEVGERVCVELGDCFSCRCCRQGKFTLRA